ncbi:MAG: acyltransferase [Sulfuritalea sp.]|nr:acyltransferase [Sulfuritalea sp.]
MNRGVYLGAFAPLRIGDRTDINRNASIDARGAVSIGQDVMIGPYAQIIAYQHVFSDPARPMNTQGLKSGPITIGDDVWIGAGAIILADVAIGCGSVVGAGAVVTRSCPPYSILAGAPARIVGTRDGRAAPTENV